MLCTYLTILILAFIHIYPVSWQLINCKSSINITRKQKNVVNHQVAEAYFNEKKNSSY